MSQLLIDQSYVQQTITIVYQSKCGAISKRVIHIMAVKDGYIVAYCYLRGNIRTFLQQRILAWEKVQRREALFI